MSSRRTRHSLSGGVTVTPRGSSKPPKVFLANGVVARCLASHPRVLAGQVPRLLRYYQGTATSCHPSRRVSFPSLGGTTGSRIFRSRRRCVQRRRAWGWSLGIPVREFFRGDGRISQSSWGTPIPVCTWSPTPAGRSVPDHLRNARMAPAIETTKAPTTTTFRGSIAWLSGSPPTYHALVSRRMQG